MARIPVDPNYSFPTFPRATAATDIFVKEDVQALAAAVSTHVHDGAGKGLLVGGPAAGSITNAMLGADVARDSLLVNGSFEQWQRGTGVFSTTGTFTADRWQISIGAGSTLQVSREATAPNVDAGSQFAMACVYTHSAQTFVNQVLNDVAPNVRGKTLTVSMRVKTNVANAVRVDIVGNVAARVIGAYHTGSGNYETLTGTITLPNNETGLQVQVVLNATCNAWLDNAMLVVGSQAANYAPLHPADDLARCLRYYEPLGGAGGTDIVVNSYAVGAATPIQVPFQFRAVKAVVPTVTKNGTWGVVNSAQPVVNVPTVLGFYVGAAAVAAGMVNFYNTGPGTNFTAESNP